MIILGLVFSIIGIGMICYYVYGFIVYVVIDIAKDNKRLKLSKDAPSIISKKLKFSLFDDTCYEVVGYEKGIETSFCIPSQYNGKPVTRIAERAFSRAESIYAISIPDSITYLGDEAFMRCENLNNIILPSKVSYLGKDIFSGCRKIKKVQMPISFINYMKTSTVVHKDRTKYQSAVHALELIEVITITSGKCIPAKAFTSDSVRIDRFDPNKYSYDAYSHSPLQSITFPTELKSIQEAAFLCCHNLKIVHLPQNLTNISKGAFASCSNITEITIPENVEIIESFTFFKCTALTSVTLPRNLKHIGNEAFKGCINLRNISIPEQTFISSDAFAETNLLDIDRGVTYVGTHACFANKRITQTTVRDGTVNISEAFANCTELTGITLPSSLAFIPEDAFRNTPKLEKINYSGTISSWKKIASNVTINCPVICYDGTLDPDEQ